MAMIKNYFFFGVLFLCTLNLQAQFEDDMESYTDGEPINEGHWTNTGCGGMEGCSLISTSALARSGSLSGLVPGDGTTQAVLDLGNIIFAEWFLQYWVYIPSGKEGVLSIQGIVPVQDENSVVGDIIFNKDLTSPGIGVVTDSALGEVYFNFPHDEWFRIVMNFDFSLGVAFGEWQFYVYDSDVLPEGTAFTNELGEPTASLGGIEFRSNSDNNEMYLDDFTFMDDIQIFNMNDYDNLDIDIYPNPSSEFVHVQSNETVKSVSIYSVLGKNILTTSNFNNIDISSLAKGMYFVVVETENGRGTQKLIKN